MSQASELRKAIETCELQHAAFQKHANVLLGRIDDALAGYSPRIEWVVGPSRVGKTMLINRLARQYPATRIEGKKNVPVLVVNTPAGISPTMLPASVFTALGVPLPQRSANAGTMSSRACDQLRMAGTKVLIFEEASHLVERGARVPPSDAGDWFKSLVDILSLTVFMFGVPRLERLFASNEQLRLRASARHEFRPYDARNPAELREFAVCVNTYAQLFKKYGFPIGMELTALVQHCYLLTGGLIGLLSRFMQELAGDMAHETTRTLTFADCAAAAQKLETTGHPEFPAFTRTEVSAIELTRVHIHTLEACEMPPLRVPAPVAH